MWRRRTQIFKSAAFKTDTFCCPYRKTLSKKIRRLIKKEVGSELLKRQLRNWLKIRKSIGHKRRRFSAFKKRTVFGVNNATIIGGQDQLQHQIHRSDQSQACDVAIGDESIFFDDYHTRMVFTVGLPKSSFRSRPWSNCGYSVRQTNWRVRCSHFPTSNAAPLHIPATAARSTKLTAINDQLPSALHNDSCTAPKVDSACNGYFCIRINDEVLIVDPIVANG